MDAIIGYTGCIGKTLYELIKDKNNIMLFNSKNISDLEKYKFEKIYCAAPGATKWLINKNPEKDLLNVVDLFLNLKNCKFEKIFLFSTIDIFEKENSKCTEASVDHNIIKKSSYGQNRKFLEKLIKDNFESHHIIRLPGIFGKNIKKNIIYDIINNNMIENISLNSEFQWFDLNDILFYTKYCEEKNLKEINLFPEPVLTKDIILNLFPEKISFCKGSCDKKYNICSKFFDNGYIYSKEISIKKITKFIKNYEK